MTARNVEAAERTEEVTDRILTLPNVISFLRLLLVPIYLWLLLSGFRVAALILFAVAAITDFLDGQIARRTHCVSKLGKLLDPAVDTVLMFTGILGVVLIGDLPAWFAVIIIAREAFLLIGGAILLTRFDIRVPVIYPGKVATTFLFFGFCGMMLGLPVVGGLPLCDIGWLPGFNGDAICVWVYLIYLGIILQIAVTIYYCVIAYRKLAAARLGEGS